MLDLACQDSSSEKTIGYHEKNKHIVKWLTGGGGERNFVKVIGKLRRILVRDEKENNAKKTNFETFFTEERKKKTFK